MPHHRKKVVYVSAVALVNDAGYILLAQRPEGRSMAGLWEFPGGKIEDGETPEETLVRELKEELGIDVSIKNLTPLTFASHDYEGFHLFMPVFVCTAWNGKVMPMEGQACAWVLARDLAQYPMPPADLPLVPHIQGYIEHVYKNR